MMTLGQKIRYYRKLSKLSQTELGKQIRADARTISQYETGKYKPSVDSIVLLAKTFGISTDKLLIETNYDYVKIFLEDKNWRDIVIQFAVLPKEDKEVVKNLVEHLMVKNKLLSQANQSQ